MKSRAFSRAGMPDGLVNTDAIPTEWVRLGLEPSADSLSLVDRGGERHDARAMVDMVGARTWLCRRCLGVVGVGLVASGCAGAPPADPDPSPTPAAASSTAAAGPAMPLLTLDEGASEQAATELIAAVRTGKLLLVRGVLARGAEVDEADEEGRTALGHAAMGGYADVVGLLLEHGANARVRDTAGRCPLWLAAYAGHHEAVERLLTAGADPRGRDDEQCSALVAALSGKHRDRPARFRIVQLLLERGADVNSPTAQGTTALMIAAYLAEPPLVDFLLRGGADARIRDRRGRTAVHYARAATIPSTTILKRLEAAGGPP